MTLKTDNPEGYMAKVADAAKNAGLDSVEGLDAALTAWFRYQDENGKIGTFYMVADAIAAYLAYRRDSQ